jgi:hypothetical protein
MKIKKEHAIVVIATIVPLGFVALGIWKAYDLIQKRKQDEKTKES